MSEINPELDERMAALEAEWRQVYEASVAARTDLDRLRGSSAANGGLLDLVRLRVERFEVLKSRVMEKIESLEDRVSGGRSVSGGH